MAGVECRGLMPKLVARGASREQLLEGMKEGEHYQLYGGGQPVVLQPQGAALLLRKAGLRTVVETRFRGVHPGLQCEVEVVLTNRRGGYVGTGIGFAFDGEPAVNVLLGFAATRTGQRVTVGEVTGWVMTSRFPNTAVMQQLARERALVDAVCALWPDVVVPCPERLLVTRDVQKREEGGDEAVATAAETLLGLLHRLNGGDEQAMAEMLRLNTLHGDNVFMTLAGLRGDEYPAQWVQRALNKISTRHTDKRGKAPALGKDDIID